MLSKIQQNNLEIPSLAKIITDNILMDLLMHIKVFEKYFFISIRLICLLLTWNFFNIEI
jgi:hypothetical protein